MQIPTTYTKLKNRRFLKPNTARLNHSCLWIDGVRWLAKLGPEISLPSKTYMVPFATSAYGDWWCWEYARTTGSCPSVILSPPDTGDCTYYSLSYESFLFKRILRFLSNDVFAAEPDSDEVRFTIEEAHEQILIWIEQLGEFFEKRWLEILLELSKTNKLATHVHSPRFKYDCLLSPDRVFEIERTMIGYELQNKTFKFDRLDVDWFGE